jgi:asparagine synthase (glutamine-hydrolysing)
MCGIVATMRFDGRPVEQRDLERMRDTMRHRGPDGQGWHIDGSVGLGLRRLAIIDLTDAGRQPMSNEDGSIWVVFNGEIYNYLELRTELVARGHQFRSHTDTEVIVHLYEELGERCVERLRGMFAFVIRDTRRDLLFGARDRLGIKPFHYYVDSKQFVCASEVKAILAAPGVPREVSRQAIADYMFSEFPLAGRSMFEGIRDLRPGHCLMVSAGRVALRKYWDVQYAYDDERSDAAARERLTELLDDSVRVHCRSDAELGCHLSGGLDSTTVTELAARHRHSMKTFSIRFEEGGWYDETVFARMAAGFAGAQYFEAVPSGLEFANLLPGLIWHMEMPLPNLGGFSYYTVSRLASQHAKVALTGHGGDEVFAGYSAQFQTAFGVKPFEDGAPDPHMEYNGGRRRSAHQRTLTLARRVSRMGVSGLGYRLMERLRARRRTSEELWVALHSVQVPLRNPLLSPRFVSALAGYSPVDDFLGPFRDAPTDQLLDRCLYHDLRSYLPGLLHMEDRMSMAMSVESRTPLLDHHIVEFMATVPARQKVPQMQPKGLLREAVRGIIPEAIRTRRDKRPFPVPFELWAGGTLNHVFHDVLLAPQSLDRGIFDPDRLRNWDLTSHELWAALNVELWFQVFIDQDPTRTESSAVIRQFASAGV